jgi:hypothetical protein
VPHRSIDKYVFRPCLFLCALFEQFTFLVLIGSLQHGSCVIQPTELFFPLEELAGMIHQCGLNRLNQFGSFLGHNIRASRTDPKILSLLASLDEILSSGLSLAREEEEWAYKNGLPLKVCFLELCLVEYSLTHRRTSTVARSSRP